MECETALQESMDTDDPQPDTTWLTSNFIQKALKDAGETDVVESIKVNSVGSGLDYAYSTLLGVEASIRVTQQPTRSLIVKTLPTTGSETTVYKNLKLYNSETLMLSKYIPLMNEYLQDALAASNETFVPFAPRCFSHGTAEYHFIVMEDLRPLGYAPGNRETGLDLEHCKLAIKTLAKFHSLSVLLLRKESKYIKRMVNPLLECAEELKSFISSGFKSAAKEVATYDNFPQTLSDTLEKLSKDAHVGFSALTNLKTSTFNVILHNDFWTNNILFRHENGRPVDVKLIDFQISAAGPAVMDLMYFIYTSLNEEITDRQVDEIIKEYTDSLFNIMRFLRLNAPTLNEIKRDIERCGFYSLYPAVCVYPFARACGPNTSDIKSALKGEVGKNPGTYSNPMLKRFFRRVLPDFDRKGWLVMPTVQGQS